MRILITTFTYIPNKDGVAEACRTMSEGLARLGWDVSVATSMEHGNRLATREELPADAVKIMDFDLRPDPANGSAQQHEIRRYQNFVADGGFDLIVNQCWEVPTTRYLQPILPTLTAKRVMVSHGYGLHVLIWQKRLTMGLGLWLRGLRFTLRNLPKLIRSYDSILFLSPQKDMGRFFDHKLAGALRHPGIEVVANGIDLQSFESAPEEFRLRHGIGDAPMALCVANYCERKNQRLAVESFRQASIPGSVLVFIGSELNDYGKSTFAMDQILAGKHPNCRVIFLEKLSREETFAAFRECDFVLLTALAETQPIVLIEAMAAGKPWVSTNTGCVASMSGGIVCKGKTALSAAIRKILSDSNLRRSLGSAGRQEALLRHDAKKNIREFDRIFRKLVQLPS
ncbi:MAG: glycosyltransferase family 4 protein [Armatimonadetes bacterium]|nr:glycosyltransferase family 4 protein [Akkermansiaceae bacterium]